MPVDETTEPEVPEPESPNLAELRAAADRGREAEARAAAAERRVAFMEAGIPYGEGNPGRLLFDGYQGEPTREAVLAAAATYGIVPPTPAGAAAPAVEITEDEQAQSRERAALSAGSEPPGGTAPDPDPTKVGLTEFWKAIEAGQTREDASDHYFGRVMTAAAKGDPRAIVQMTDRQRETLAKG